VLWVAPLVRLTYRERLVDLCDRLADRIEQLIQWLDRCGDWWWLLVVMPTNLLIVGLFGVFMSAYGKTYEQSMAER